MFIIDPHGGLFLTNKEEMTMRFIDEMKEKLSLEIRSSVQDTNYFEAVIERKDLAVIQSILTCHLGPAAKEPGKEAAFSKEIQEVVNTLGGIRGDQSFYYKKEGKQVAYTALWPWQSNPQRITLKAGTLAK
jgi:hypothetical protein